MQIYPFQCIVDPTAKARADNSLKNKYRIRFNKSRGMAGRGSVDHAWRVFENEQEYLVKHFKLNVPSTSEKETNGDDWNLVCYGVMVIDKETSTAIINEI
jgi:hypothetical protein